MGRVRRILTATVLLAVMIVPVAGSQSVHAARKSCLARPNLPCSVVVPGGGPIKITWAGVTSRNGGVLLADGDLIVRFGGAVHADVVSLPPGFCSCVLTLRPDPPSGILLLSVQY